MYIEQLFTQLFKGLAFSQPIITLETNKLDPGNAHSLEF